MLQETEESFSLNLCLGDAKAGEDTKRLLLSLARQKLEGLCTAQGPGVLLPRTLQVQQYTAGPPGLGPDKRTFCVQLSGTVLHAPALGTLLEVAVTTNVKLKIGLEEVYQGGLNILIPRDQHRKELDSLQAGDRIRVEVQDVFCRPQRSGMSCTAKFLSKV
jgi:hypothetical protein